MNRAMVVAALTVGMMASSSARTDAAVILTDAMLGYYNAALGTTLDGSAGFPCANIVCGDPNVPPIAPAPDLTAGAAILGGWLGATPLPLNANWSAAPQAIPASWAINTETAILFQFTTATPVQLTGSFGVDNGLYVWVDGVYQFGAMAPGGVVLFEYPNYNLGVLGAGTHYLQILREDHGGSAGWGMSVDATPVPEPSMLVLLIGGGALGILRARKRRAAAARSQSIRF